MFKGINHYLRLIFITALLIVLVIASLCVFFDQVILVRKDTIFHADSHDNVIALTFDDGPSPQWTGQILDQLKEWDVRATFFMIGQHVAQYPDLARRVAREGHEIGNHSYTHHGIFFYTKDELQQEVLDTEKIIKAVTGRQTTCFRPPKAWITNDEKKWLKDLGYQVVLWTLNPKDWVTFDDKYIIKYILKKIKPGDIILFHDSGGVFNIDHGNRHETVKTLPRLIKELKAKGYRFVTISELIGERDH